MRIEGYIEQLIHYGIQKQLVGEEDTVYLRNAYLSLFAMEEYHTLSEEEQCGDSLLSLPEILTGMLDYAIQQGLIEENTITRRDLFDTKIMGLLVPMPRQVIKTFKEQYTQSPKKATDYFYQLAKDSDYIRTYRVEKDCKWKTKTPFGELDITINLSKPEKDPRDIAAAGKASAGAYPKCLLCRENEGYAGRISHPARQNLRVIPLTLNNEPWGLQYSPYVYYNEHCIVFNQKHVPMKIDHSCFIKLFEFVSLFPHYFIGSNADLPIVGGSILSHDHFQGGNYIFPMAKAHIDTPVTINGFEDVEAGIVAWPMSVLRIRHRESDRLVSAADKILAAWRLYSDDTLNIHAFTGKEPHNTVTPIARKCGDFYELDLVLRNNLTSEEHPLGIYHPHAKLHHIKKENIGLIEVMGLAVLPSRLKAEMEELSEALINGAEISTREKIAKHAQWVDELRNKYTSFTPENTETILRDEIGQVFLQVLTDAGVYKRDKAGQQGFLRFIQSI